MNDQDSEPGRPRIRRPGRWVYAVGVLIFLVYASWIIGPYLRSVIVRDAAVTSWSNVATAPIEGELEFQQGIDEVVGEDGVIANIRNDHLSREALSRARIRLDHARARVRVQEEYLRDIKELDRERARFKSQYADIFRAEVDVEIVRLQREMEVTSGRLDVMRKIATRKERLEVYGAESDAAVDEATLRVSELERQLKQLQSDIDHARVRREAADTGVFITVDGEDPDWVRGSRIELKLEKKQARLELRQAQAELELARAALGSAEDNFRRLSEAAVTALPGSIIWSARVAPGAVVQAGSPVAEWLDCSVLMVDVPVSDTEVSLIKPGDDANVVLEGETVVRKASVLLTRGSASTLEREDLAALAKGRREGVAQVLLNFSTHRDAIESCPVGRAAYVDFPGVGLIDIIRARLRL